MSTNIYNAIQNLYNMDKVTWQEVLSELYNLVSDTNQRFDTFETKFELIIGTEVTKVIKQMYDDGTLSTIINEEVFSGLNSKIDLVKQELMQSLSDYKTEVQGKFNDVKHQLDSIIKYPLLDIEKKFNTVVLKYPYGYIERYGADPTGIIDSSTALQNCVNFVEWYNKKLGKICPIVFGSGKYLMNKPIFLKSGKSENEEFSTPLVFKGVESKYLTARNSVIGEKGIDGTLILIDLPNCYNKDYANLFVVNNIYNLDNDDTNIMFNSTNIVNNLTLKNIAFIGVNNSNINVIKGYRFRTFMENIYCNNVNRLVYQPIQDTNKNNTYCDFSMYKNINFENIGLCGLELGVADNTIIEQITNHRLKPTFNSLIKIYGGGGIRISHLHSAYHFTEGTLNPRQDGTGKYGLKSIINLQQTTGVTIENIYVERPLADYFLLITNSVNVTLKNYYERFLGNGLIRIRDNCKNIIVENIYRDSNIVTDYDDIFSDNHDYETFKITNFKANNYYSDVVTLSTDLTNLTVNTTKTKRYIAFNTTQKDNKNLIMDDIVLKVDVTSNVLNVKNTDGTISDLINCVWNSGKIELSSKQTKLPLYIKNINIKFLSNSIVPLIPCISNIESSSTYYIRFYSLETNSYISDINDKISIYVTLETIL